MSPAALHKVVSILFGSGLTLIVAALLGRLYQRALRERLTTLTRVEVRLFAFAVGAALLSNLVFLLCAVRLVYDAAFFALAVLILAAWWRWRPVPAVVRTFPVVEEQVAFWNLVLLLIAAFYGYLYLAHALAPETRADGVAYHLGLVRRYYREHGFLPITTTFYAHLTQGAEMLLLFAYAFGRHSAAKMVHFSFFLATLAAMLVFARRYGYWRAGIVAVILYGCSPVVGADAASTYNDCALAFYQFMVFYGLLLWWQERDSVSLPTLGVLAGFCFALKYTGAVALAAVLVTIVCKALRDSAGWRTLLRWSAVSVAVAALFIAPWLVKNAIVVRNPVAPFFNDMFPNPYLTLSWEREYRTYFRTYSYSPQQDRWYTYPLELTVRGIRLGGIVGPIFLLSPLALFAWRSPAGKALLAAAVVSFLPWLANAGTRFLIPTLVFLSLALGISLFRLSGRWAAVLGCTALVFHAISSWPSVLARWNEGASSLIGIPWKAALRIQPEREYLLENVLFYATGEVISRDVAPPGRVFSLVPLPEAYFDAELLVSYQAALNQELTDALLTAVEPDLWPSRQRVLAWPPRPMRGFRIVQMNDHDSPWRMSEIGFLTEQGPIRSEPNWTVTADPRPWSAPRLLDGDPLSSWNSWESLRKGMWIEVRFPQPLTLSGAEIIYPWGQHFVEFQYFALDGSGNWQQLEVQSQQSRRPFSPAVLKKWAIQKLARHGVELLVTNLEFGGYKQLVQAIDEDPGAWGVREIGREGPLRIYRLGE